MFRAGFLKQKPRFLTQLSHKAKSKIQTQDNTQWTGSTVQYTHHIANLYHVRRAYKTRNSHYLAE